ncbi:MAG: hypothetical protein AVDCRST_MAG76-3300 [uncultured Acidimicrobiales bacterium]|uniref:Lipoprotein n=1 Tax=uncultured Acidimicrobiales bacterium TaxID=310071 RepID=A0A6J4J806_9ACTN|nr:MAG: hypothetical protein AVDCRST_MAG76-3300 [uncultured Acidimicrobiales bacterium]
MRRWLAMLLLVTGCRNASGGVGTTTSVPPPSTTATTVVQPTSTTQPSFEVPAVIDLPYVQRVLETIYHLDGEAARHVYSKKVPDAELNARLEAIFGDPALSEARRVLGENAADGFVRFANPPGDAKVRAVEIIQATPTCVIIRADLDYGPQFKEPRPRQPEATIQLGRADVLPLNPTGWGVAFAGVPDPGHDIKVCR